MCAMMLALLCMACAGQGRRVTSSSEVADMGLDNSHNPSRMLALALLTQNPEAGFQLPGSLVSGRRDHAGRPFAVATNVGSSRAFIQGLERMPLRATRANPSCIRCQEAPADASADKESEQEPPKGLEDPEDAVVDLIAEASDPFRLIRGIIYVTFGITGLAGVIISAVKGAFADVAINGVVLAAGVAVFLFDRQKTSELQENAKQELKNPLLKGDAVMRSEKEEEKEEDKK